MIKTTPLGLLLAVALSFLAILSVALSFEPARSLPAASPASAGDHHFITLKASALPSGQLAYEMVSHKIKSPDGQTGKSATIPGPTLVMKEGDTAEVTLEHGVTNSSQPISIHVHGVHIHVHGVHSIATGR